MAHLSVDQLAEMRVVSRVIERVVRWADQMEYPSVAKWVVVKAAMTAAKSVCRTVVWLDFHLVLKMAVE